MDILLITVIAILVMYIGIDKDPRNPKNQDFSKTMETDTEN